ncbi:MAG: hypothetical protein WCA46_06905 [Actinocatenispora sp.]
MNPQGGGSYQDPEDRSPTLPLSPGVDRPTLPPPVDEATPTAELVPRTVPLPVPAAAEPVLVRIGEIHVTPGTVHTPHGSFPLRGSTWMLTDRVHPVQRTPGWAIALAIVGFFCLTFFSLLFLLAKETRYGGFVEVFVGNGHHQYVARIPVTDPAVAHAVNEKVNYARSLAVR